jgi:hypothetical protein
MSTLKPQRINDTGARTPARRWQPVEPLERSARCAYLAPDCSPVAPYADRDAPPTGDMR